jgi:hypothetical protein
MRESTGHWIIRPRTYTATGEESFVLGGRISAVLLLSNKSRHFLLRNLNRLCKQSRLAADRVPMTPDQTRCRDESERMINLTEFTALAAVTLTMKKRNGGRTAEHIVASENFRHFSNRLSIYFLVTLRSDTAGACSSYRLSK